MRLESVFMQVKSRYISDNHASRALRCFKKNCACCHWSRGLKVTFDVRSSAKKGGWQGLCRGSRIVQGNWKYSGGGQGFSASLSVSIPLGLECEFLQGLSKILLSLAPKRKPKQLQHSPLEQVKNLTGHQPNLPIVVLADVSMASCALWEATRIRHINAAWQIHVDCRRDMELGCMSGPFPSEHTCQFTLLAKAACVQHSLVVSTCCEQ